VALFLASVVGMTFVQNQFFPSSERPEILVDLNLPQNASIQETRKVVERLKPRSRTTRTSCAGAPTSARARSVSTCPSTSNCKTRTTRSW
jgi:multidrug efflux pump subunit AcrB